MNTLPTETRKILLVDDEIISSKVLAARLTQRGFVVKQAASGQEALEEIAREKPDLVLLDVLMPGLSGLDVLRTLRQIHQATSLPIIMVTALESVGDITRALREGANDYIAKPVELDIAIARISTHITIANLHRENMARSELEAIHAMIVTYNHEINNPLTVALANLEMMSRSPDPVHAERVRGALMRIAAITRQISQIREKGVAYETYMNSAKMLKLSKDAS